MFLFMLSSVSFASESMVTYPQDVQHLSFVGVSTRCAVHKHNAYKPGRLYVASDKVNLREKASTDSNIQMELPLGTVVEAGKCERSEVIGRWGC